MTPMNVATMPNVQQAMSSLIQLGYPPHVAAGMVGNFVQESRRDGDIQPTAFNPAENARGISQWTPTGGRQAAMWELANNRGFDMTTIPGQVRAVDAELRGTESASYDPLMMSSTPAQSAAIFDQSYLRSAGTERPERIAYANTVYDWYNSLPPEQQAAMAANPELAEETLMADAATMAEEDLPSTIADDDRNSKVTIDPGAALASLGAVLMSNGYNENPTRSVTAIREQYINRRQEEEERQRQRQSAKMLADMYGIPAEQAMSLDPQILAAMIESRADRENRLEVVDRNNASRWQIASANLGEDARQFAIRNDLDERKFLQSQDKLAEDIRRWDITDERKRQEIAQQNTQWGAEFALRAAEFDRGAQGAEEAREFVANTYEQNGQSEMAEKIRAMDAAAFQDPQKLNQFRQMAEETYMSKDHRTAAMKEWDRYQTMLSAAEQEADPTKRAALRSRANQYWNSIQDKNSQGEWFKEQYKSDLGLSDKDFARIETNNNNINALNRMEAVLARGFADTGQFQAIVQPYMEVLLDMEILPESFRDQVLDNQTIDQIGKYLSTQVKTAGSISNYEQQTFEKIVAGLRTPEERLRAHINHFRRSAERDNAKSIFMRSQLKPDGSGMRYVDAMAEWEQKVERGDADTAPEYMNLSTFTPENITAFEQANGIRLADPASWRNVMVFYNGRAMPYIEAYDLMQGED